MPAGERRKTRALRALRRGRGRAVARSQRSRGPCRSGPGIGQRTPARRSDAHRVPTTRPAALGLAALAAAPAAAQRSHIGAHVGYDFDRDFAVAGGQLSLPLNYVVELYPSVDVYLGEPAGESL